MTAPEHTTALRDLEDAQAEVRYAAEHRLQATQLRRNAIRHARAVGVIWDDIARVLGITRPAAIAASKERSGEVE